MINQNNIQCTKSRFDVEWYKKFYPLIDFIINKIILAIVLCATIYEFQRGDFTRLSVKSVNVFTFLCIISTIIIFLFQKHFFPNFFYHLSPFFINLNLLNISLNCRKFFIIYIFKIQ